MFRHWTRLLRGADATTGRQPLALCSRFLYHGRIVGTATSGPAEFRTGEFETVLICIRGLAFVLTHDESYELIPYDALYIPRSSEVRVDADGLGCELLEFAAPVEGEYPLQLIPFQPLQGDSVHDVSILGPNTRTGRLSAGLSLADPGSAIAVAGKCVTDRFVVAVEMPSKRAAIVWAAASLAEASACCG